MNTIDYTNLLEKIRILRKQLYNLSNCEYEPTEEFLLIAVDTLDEAIQELDSHIISELDRIESESGY